MHIAHVRINISIYNVYVCRVYSRVMYIMYVFV